MEKGIEGLDTVTLMQVRDAILAEGGSKRLATAVLKRLTAMKVAAQAGKAPRPRKRQTVYVGRKATEAGKFQIETEKIEE